MPKIRKLLSYLAGGLLALIVLLPCVGFVYERSAEARDRRLNHQPGQLIDVGGYSMHLYCIGQGSPTVVLDSGLGDYWLSWFKVQPQISQLTRVCSYDRAGIGWSDPSPQKRTSKIYAQEMRLLLQRASIPAPYVLVGHSMGGINVRIFTDLYPADVAGMILVDSTDSHFDRRLSSKSNQFIGGFRRVLDVQGFLMPIGIPRLLGWCGNPILEPQSMARTVECQRQFFREMHDEWIGLDEEDFHPQVTSPLGKMPLVVLSHDPDVPFMPGLPADVSIDVNQAWESMQLELVRLSANSSRVIAKGSAHYVQVDRPDVVIKAVQKVVGECRAAQQPASRP
jgi:pimeloyl-ACP methyl ester carboxylesterase